MASISSFEIGVRFGCSDAFPPIVFGMFKLAKKNVSASFSTCFVPSVIAKRETLSAMNKTDSLIHQIKLKHKGGKKKNDESITNREAQEN